VHARWTSRSGKGIGQYDAERIYNEPAVINHSPQFGRPACMLRTHRRSNTQSRPVMYKGDFKTCSYLGAAEHLNMNCPRGPGTPKPCKTNAFEGGPEAPGTVHIHMFGGADRIPDRNVRGGDAALVVLVPPPERHAPANKRSLRDADKKPKRRNSSRNKCDPTPDVGLVGESPRRPGHPLRPSGALKQIGKPPTPAR
jgi:hypothetical protein